jgi:hypothetical protein
MSLPDSITVRENSAPARRYTFTNADAGVEQNPDTAVNITGYVFKLAVKNNEDDPDAEMVFDLTAALIDAVNGVLEFAFTADHTLLAPGGYPAELRWWTAAPAAGQNPKDGKRIPYTIERAIDAHA